MPVANDLVLGLDTLLPHAPADLTVGKEHLESWMLGLRERSSSEARRFDYAAEDLDGGSSTA